MSNAGTTGSKYEVTKDLDLAQVAKLVRADIKATQKAGFLPAGLECSVRISRYSMGQSLDVRITAAPFVVYVPEHQVDANRDAGVRCPFLTRSAVAAFDVIEAIVEAYNRDRSDTQSDHFDVRFYGHVEFSISRAVDAELPRAA
jgi:hypothetical protein